LRPTSTNLLQPTVDTLFGKPCLAVHVQPRLTAQAQADLHGFQQAVVAQWPGALHQPPAHSLHVTIYPVIPITNGFDKDAYWNEIGEAATALLTEFCAEAEPFELLFFRLQVTPVGAIAVARDETGQIDRLRERIVATLPPPPGLEHRHYDLIHSTLTRFSAPHPVPASVVERIEALPVSLSVRVERLRIFRETLFPCLAGEEIVSVPLGRNG
jgi:2'-5' RNA ligase superfamily